MELDTVLSDLERIGYACRPFVIPACGVDARHRRNRVWIVAYANIAGGGNNCELTPHGKHFLRPSGEKAHLGLDQAVKLRQRRAGTNRRVTAARGFSRPWQWL